MDFDILGKTITLLSEEMSYGRSTVAILEDEYYYLGNEYPSISSAIFAWEALNYRSLSNKELKKILIDNKLVD